MFFITLHLFKKPGIDSEFSWTEYEKPDKCNEILVDINKISSIMHYENNNYTRICVGVEYFIVFETPEEIINKIGRANVNISLTTV